MSLRHLITPCLIVVGVFGLTSFSARPRWPSELRQLAVSDSETTPAQKISKRPWRSSAAARSVSLSQAAMEFDRVVDEVNGLLAAGWDESNLSPAPRATDLTIWRRLALALHGTIPSLAEIRRFEQLPSDRRFNQKLDEMLEDERFNQYFAERLARGFVGTEVGQFIIYRRDRFLHWLAEQMRDKRPYDEIVRDMVTGSGVWTGNGEVNFITASYADNEFDPNKLTARSTRAFLGQRIDCAQCHDHPFDHWTQTQFAALTAFYAPVAIGAQGVYDQQNFEYQVADALTQTDQLVPPSVPFHPEWCGEDSGNRQALANWLTHRENRRFERAAVNRVWALLFGTPYLVDREVDDIPDPDASAPPDVLDILGADFRNHNYDLRRLIKLIAALNVFQLSSTQATMSGTSQLIDQPKEVQDQARRVWAKFPLVRLRPEQVIGAMIQANHIQVVDQNSHFFVRALRFFREKDFVDEFGDPGTDELGERSGTVAQSLLRMNGKLSNELTNKNLLFAPGRIAALGSSPSDQIETAYLVCLTRRPTATEMDYFLPQFDDRAAGIVMEDVYWILFNSPEFSWNH